MTHAEETYARVSSSIHRRDDGVWVAYYSDGSGVNVYETEVDALRAAVETSMQVAFWPFGKSLQEVQR